MNDDIRERIGRQLALEDESRALGADRYRAQRPLPWRSETSATKEEASPPEKLQRRFAGDFESLGAALAVIISKVPHRTTARQVLFFYTVAYADAMGHSVSLHDILASFPPDVMGRSIEKSAELFFEPDKKNPEGLGWIEREVNPDDRRQKWLRLSPAGKAVAEEVVDALRGR